LSDGTPGDALPPAGLGGWLWPVTWASAVLPVFLTASVVESVPSFIGYLEQAKAGPYIENTTWAWRAMGLNLLLTLVAWWWALRWFARDPYLPRQGPIVLMSLGLLCSGLAAIDRHPYDDPTLAASLLAFAIAGLLCVRWSKRIRNTFTTDAMPAHANEFDTALFGGPRDWSRGYWLLPGALLYAVFGLFTEWTVFADVATKTIPPPHPADPANDGCGFGLAVVGSGYSMRQIEAYREALTISHIAGLLLLGAVTGFVRGARWAAWVTIAALALAMAAPLRITRHDWCSSLLDHTDFRGMWHEWCVVLILMTVATGIHRLPRRMRLT
jgi:hypothetical protein